MKREFTQNPTFLRRLRRRRFVAWSVVGVAQMIFAVTLIGFLSTLSTENVRAQSSVRPPDNATSNVVPDSAAPSAGEPAVATDGSRPTGGAVPGNARGIKSQSDFWRTIRGRTRPAPVPGAPTTAYGERRGTTGDEAANGTGSNSESGAGSTAGGSTTLVPSAIAPGGLPNSLVQIEGSRWLAWRGGPLATYGSYGLAGILALLAIFYLLRGRVRIEGERTGTTIVRFSAIERFGHWLLAISFIVLALTGLNVLYGRGALDLIYLNWFGYERIPYDVKNAFSAALIAGKWLHNNIAWAFMLGLVMIFLMWVVHNIPSPRDVVWLLKGGGLLTKGVHPDAKKFNAGQKIVFWAVILLGISISLSGLALLFPFQTAMVRETFGTLNAMPFGLHLPVELTLLQEMQYQTLWHAMVGLALIVVVIAHIYIGTLGMEGAFDAMGSGQFDVTWAREHHNLWVAEKLGEQVHRGRGPDQGSGSVESGSPAPAE